MFDIYSANEWSTKKRKDFLCDQLKNWPSLFNFLNQKDFCCMPLPNIYPTMNYDPTEGGLFFYSLEVARTLQNLTTHMSLTWKREESPLLIGLLHAIWILDGLLLRTIWRLPGAIRSFAKRKSHLPARLWR